MRPPEVIGLTCIAAVSGLACVLLAVHPVSPRAPGTFDAVAAAVGLLGAGLLWWVPRVPRAVLHAGVVVWLTGLTAGIMLAPIPQGATAIALPYLWVVLYTAYFFSGRAARVYAGIAAGAFLLAVLVNPFQGAPAIWLVIAFTAVIGSELVTRLLGKLRRAALVDGLTGLYNRTALVTMGAEQIAAARRHDRDLCVAVIDLDDFKQVNDQRGHATGDRLLVTLARQWSGLARSTDLLFRSGGDEFVMLLPASTLAEASAGLVRIRDGSAAAWSCGVAQLQDGDDLDACLARADAELYRAKALRPARQAAQPQ